MFSNTSLEDVVAAASVAVVDTHVVDGKVMVPVVPVPSVVPVSDVPVPVAPVVSVVPVVPVGPSVVPSVKGAASRNISIKILKTIAKLCELLTEVL